jgi:crossover junction endodeoxyribonuclease RuvC
LQNNSNIILGIDPGTVIMGYGLIEVTGQQVRLLETGVLKLSSIKDAYQKLFMIHNKIQQLIGQFKPHYFAIEAPFFGKNVQSMLKLGRAQGAAIASAMQCGIPVKEYSPKKIKQSITGNGNADKEQVWKMLQTILQVTGSLQHYDASDALAVALCHHFQGPGLQKSMGKLNGWADYLKKNPARLKSK